MLTLTWSIDISFEKLTLETGGLISKTPFALGLGGGVGISCKACGLEASELTRDRRKLCMLPCIVAIFMGLGGAKR